MTQHSPLSALRIASCLLALAVHATGCDGGSSSQQPVCGDGIKANTEQCDKGVDNGAPNSGCSTDCKLVGIAVASVQVVYTRLANESSGYIGASCDDLGIGRAHVVLDGPSPAEEDWNCTTNSRLYSNVTPGQYKATITLYDKQGAALTKAVSSALKDVDLSAPVDLTINFKPADFLKQDYKGTLYFLAHWGVRDQKCSQASPAVDLAAITLKSAAGTLVSGTTTDGAALNGTDGPCYEPTPTVAYQKVPDLPWGHYDITIAGKSGSAVSYCKSFDVFVGPGIATPTFALIVDAATSCP